MYQTWIKTFFITFLGMLGVIVGLNTLADPMLVTPFVHRLNNRVRFINERQQKTNRLFFSRFYGLKDFDGILLGSSRSNGIDTRLFAPEYTVFNYAAAASQPAEAVSYLSFAQEVHGRDLKLVVMGLDFMSSGGVKSQSRIKGRPVIYTQDVKKPFFALANLMNLKALHLATRILRANLHATKPTYYHRREDTVAEYYRVTPAQQAEAFVDTMEVYRRIYAQYQYNPDYKTVLQEIKDTFPRARFIVFTTPVSQPHFQMLLDAGLLPAYKQWLTDIADVFGEVWHFMDLNEVTRDYNTYFADSHHLFVRASDLMIRKIQQDPAVPADFGKKLTPQTLPDYLRTLP